jgi:hypothetical protein
MLVALIYLYTQSGGSFALADWYKLPLSSTAQTLLFFAFFAAFAVKVPMWPVHTWLPDVHVEAPTGGSAVLAAIMLKLGAYGFLRFSLPILPDASHEWAWLMIALSLVAVVYVGLVAMVQQPVLLPHLGAAGEEGAAAAAASSRNLAASLLCGFGELALALMECGSAAPWANSRDVWSRAGTVF